MGTFIQCTYACASDAITTALWLPSAHARARAKGCSALLWERTISGADPLPAYALREPL